MVGWGSDPYRHRWKQESGGGTLFRGEWKKRVSIQVIEMSSF